MPKTPDRTQPGSLLIKGVPPVDGPIRPARPPRTADSVHTSAGAFSPPRLGGS
jgi:hypothetical protein